MNTSILNGFITANLENDLGVYGVHLYREGKQDIEHRFRSNERVHLFSGSKAFTSLAIGIAADEKRLTLRDKALDFFPEYRDIAQPGSEAITVTDLLQMRAGHDASLFSTLEETHERRLDWAELFFSTPMDYPAGESFYYDNGCSYLLSRIIEKVSGDTLRDFLMPRLFIPLDIFNPQWHSCPRGHNLGAVGLYLNTQEFARLGILLLHNGRWDDKQIASERYVAQAQTDTVAVRGFPDTETQQGYGYQLWRCTLPNTFRADGKYGQYSIVLKDYEAVVTVTAHNERCAFDILRAVYSEIVPGL